MMISNHVRHLSLASAKSRGWLSGGLTRSFFPSPSTPCSVRRTAASWAPNLLRNKDEDEECRSSGFEIQQSLSVAAMDPLLNHFLERVIDYGVPSMFVLSVLGIGSFLIRSSQKDQPKKDMSETRTPVSELYDDLYGDSRRTWGNRGGNPVMSILDQIAGTTQSENDIPKNSGIPAQQYLKLTHFNRRLESYDYSLMAATQSRAEAALAYRQASLERALEKSLASSDGQDGVRAALDPTTVRALEKAEETFLKQSRTVIAKMQNYQSELTRSAIDQQLKNMGISSPYSLYNSPTNAPGAENKASEKAEKKASGGAETTGSTTKEGTDTTHLPIQEITPKALGQMRQEIQKLTFEMHQLEGTFLRQVIRAVGPERAISLRATLLGDVAARGGWLLSKLGNEERPLTALLNPTNSSCAGANRKPRLYVTSFKGDMFASQVGSFRETVTGILRAAEPNVDEVLVVLKSGGGTVTGYGAAAGQLLRIRNADIKLTIVVEEIAASGGYLMCCVASKIISSPFAALGSIGVVQEMPNAYERLQREGITLTTVTAGKYKRTLTPFKKIEPEDVAKDQEHLEDVLAMFRDFISENRPQVDLDEVATGEVWYGTEALKRNLCDEIQTVDDTMIGYVKDGFDVYEVEYTPPRKGLQRLLSDLESEQDDGVSWAQRSIRWFVRSVAHEVAQSFDSNTFHFMTKERPLRAQDDRADRVKL